MQSALDKTLNGALRQFGAAKEGARRFQKAEIGDVDPQHCFADWLMCVGTDNRQRLRKEYKCEWHEYKSAMAEGQGAVGGYLVPTEFRTDLYDDVAENSLMRQRGRALVVPMDSDTLKVPLPDAQTVQSAGTTPFYGGIVLTPLAEANAVAEQAEPTWRQVELNAWTLTGYLKASNTLLQDARGLEAYLRQMIARSVGYYEDYYFLRGTGVGQPMGITNSGARLNVTRNTGSHLKSQDPAGMLAKLLPSGYNRAIWLFAVDAVIDIVQLTGYFPNYPDQIEPGSRAVGTLFGRPAYPSEKLVALGTSGDFILTDPTRYVIGDREEIGLAMSEHVNFLNNQNTWRIIHRVDGQPWFSGAITLQDASRTVSTIVGVTT